MEDSWKSCPACMFYDHMKLLYTMVPTLGLLRISAVVLTKSFHLSNLSIYKIKKFKVNFQYETPMITSLIQDYFILILLLMSKYFPENVLIRSFFIFFLILNTRVIINDIYSLRALFIIQNIKFKVTRTNVNLGIYAIYTRTQRKLHLNVENFMLIILQQRII